MVSHWSCALRFCMFWRYNIWGLWVTYPGTKSFIEGFSKSILLSYNPVLCKPYLAVTLPCCLPQIISIRMHDDNSGHNYGLTGLPRWLSGKESACQRRRYGFDPWVGKIWRRERLPTAVFWPGEFHGLYSPWVAKSWTWLSDFHFHI